MRAKSPGHKKTADKWEPVMREDDQDPAPMKDADAERVTSENADQAPRPEELEDDPAQNPEDESLRDVKGG